MFYAVAHGRVPGVYTDPAHAIDQIQGFTGSVIRQCNSREEAEACVHQVVFYAVVAGRVPGVYTDAAVAISQTDGFPRASIRQFASHDEAEACLRQDVRVARSLAMYCQRMLFCNVNYSIQIDRVFSLILICNLDDVFRVPELMRHRHFMWVGNLDADWLMDACACIPGSQAGNIIMFHRFL